MKKEIIVAENVYKGYTQAVRAGDTIYVAGMVGVDVDGKIAGDGRCACQSEQAFENLKRVLEAAGAGLTSVVKMTIYIKKYDDRWTVLQSSRKYFPDYFPAATMVVVDSLFQPDILLEVEAVAVA